MGVLAFHLALFSPEAQTDVWGDDPDVLMASSYMQTGRATASAGGVTLSGQWRFASGADHAEWFLLGGKIECPDGDEAAVFLVPRSDLTIDTIWQPPGLRATGSQDLHVAARFVPAHRIHPIRERFRGDSPGLKVNAAPVYRVPLPQLLVRVISVPAIGALRAGLASLVDHNACRRNITGQAVANNPSVQLIIGQVAADLDEMEVILAKALQRLMDAAHDGRELPIRDRMLLRLQATRIADRCCGLMHKVFIAAGASGLSASSPFGGILADIQAARQHAANQFEPFALALGANLLGLEQEDTLL
jgi:3-hydroxy-9,10-secoandrosta-1,3,5(10)-triene-9,17-dione monooxygenase